MFPDRSFFILYSIITSLDPLLTCSAINSIRIAFPRDLNLTFQSHAPGESNDFGSLFNREFLTNYALLVTCSFVKPRFNTVIEIAPASAIRVFDYAESLPITRNAHLSPPTTLRIILIRVLGGFYRASPLHVHWIFTRQSLASFDTRVIARPTTCVVHTSSTHDKGAARSSWTRPRVFLVVVYASSHRQGEQTPSSSRPLSLFLARYLSPFPIVARINARCADHRIIPRHGINTRPGFSRQSRGEKTEFAVDQDAAGTIVAVYSLFHASSRNPSRIKLVVKDPSRNYANGRTH